MESIDEKIAQAKKRALILWLEGEYWRQITYQKWEEHYLKTLREEEEREARKR